MKLKFSLSFFLLSIILFPFLAKGQNALFSQYYEPTPLLQNPAWAAARQEIWASLNFRRQQIGIGQGISTSAFQFVFPLVDASNYQAGGFGLLALNERAGKGGLLQTNAILANLAYRVNFTEYDHLAFSLQGGYFFRRLNANLLTTESQYTINGFDASLPLNEPLSDFRSDFPAVNAGLLWYGEDDEKLLYYVGVAGYTLNRPNTTWFAEVSRIPLLWNITGEFFLAEKDNWTFHPTARYMEQSSRRNLSLGALARYNAKERNEQKYRLGAGLWYNTNKALVASLDFWQKNYQFSFSYDFALGNRNIAGQTLSAFEISLLWRNPFERNQKSKTKKQKIEKKDNDKPPISQIDKPNPTEKPQDTLNKDSQIRLDTTQKMTKQAGEANRVEQKGSLKVIIREPIEISAKKSKSRLSPLEKQMFKPVFPDKDGFLEIDKSKIYQIAQILEKNEDLKIKIVIFANREYSETEFLKIQADDLKEKLILQGIAPERIIRQNIVRKNEKNRLEWVILQK